MIHAICLVKNESDIIVRTLTAAAEWADFIYIHDNGSSDGTWETVLDLSRRLPQVVPFKQDRQPFSDALRREAFHHYRGRASLGDWWGVLGADEIYIDAPNVFLPMVPSRYGTVWSASFQYYLTEQDVERFNQDPNAYSADAPLEQKCRFYINNWSEVRFFRDNAWLTWQDDALPRSLGRSYEKRIRLKHYQYRSPEQIAQRLETRRPAITQGSFRHEVRDKWSDAILLPKHQRDVGAQRIAESWTERVIDSSILIRDNGTDYIMREELMPQITDLHSSATFKIVQRLPRTVGRLVRWGRGRLW